MTDLIGRKFGNWCKDGNNNSLGRKDICENKEKT